MKKIKGLVLLLVSLLIVSCVDLQYVEVVNVIPEKVVVPDTIIVTEEVITEVEVVTIEEVVVVEEVIVEVETIVEIETIVEVETIVTEIVYEDVEIEVDKPLESKVTVVTFVVASYSCGWGYRDNDKLIVDIDGKKLNIVGNSKKFGNNSVRFEGQDLVTSYIFNPKEYYYFVIQGDVGGNITISLYNSEDDIIIDHYDTSIDYYDLDSITLDSNNASWASIATI